MAGTLYIVATPIGNLDDMPPRVAATFGAADFIAAEDTRVTMKLLNFLGLKKPMVSYYEHGLQKGMVVPFMINNTVRVIHPLGRGMEMIPWPHWIFVSNFRCSFNITDPVF